MIDLDEARDALTRLGDVSDNMRCLENGLAGMLIGRVASALDELRDARATAEGLHMQIHGYVKQLADGHTALNEWIKDAGFDVETLQPIDAKVQKIRAKLGILGR